MAGSSSSDSSSSSSSSGESAPKRARTSHGRGENSPDVPESSTRRRSTAADLPHASPNLPDAMHVYLRNLMGPVIDRVSETEFRRTRNMSTHRLITDAAVSLVHHAALLTERAEAGVDFELRPLTQAMERESKLLKELDAERERVHQLQETVDARERYNQQLLLDNDRLRLELRRSEEALRMAREQQLRGTARAGTPPDEEVVKRVDQQGGGHPGGDQ